DVVLHRPRLLSGWHLHGRPYHGRDPSHHRESRDRSPLVWHLHSAGRRDGADHAARWLQSIRVAGHDQQSNHVDRAPRLTHVLFDGGRDTASVLLSATGDFPSAPDENGIASERV